MGGPAMILPQFLALFDTVHTVDNPKRTPHTGGLTSKIFHMRERGPQKKADGFSAIRLRSNGEGDP